MNIFDSTNTVSYSCSCDKIFPLHDLYYCNACQKNTCKYCVTEEIDSYYCPNCLENLASAEAMLNQNRCKRCYECPMCFGAMTHNSNRYYLNCASCHWNSLSIGMTADNPYNIKKEFDKAPQQEYTKVLELVQREAREIAALKDKNRPLNRRRLPTRQSLLSSPSVGSMASAQNRAPISLNEVEKQQEDKLKKITNFQKLLDEEIKDPVPEHLYNITDLNQITTLQQRQMNLHVNAPFLPNLVPLKKLLHTRRSKRCRKCDQLLIKPDLNFEISKVEFKRLRIAYAVLPRVLAACPLKISDKGIAIELEIYNPLHSVVDLKFSPLSLPHHTLQVSELPPATFIPGIPEEDEEESHEVKARKESDDTKFILSRAKNKMRLLLNATPLQAEKPTWAKFGFQVEASFKDTTAADQVTSFKIDFKFQLPQ